MTELTTPGFYRLSNAQLFPFLDGDPRIALDIKNFITGISITESVNADSIRGSLRILDSGGLLESYPIRGEERLYLEFEDALKKKRGYYFFVFKIENVKASNNNDGIAYSLNFVTFQRFLADQKRITAAHNSTVSSIVTTIFNENYKLPFSGPVPRTQSDVVSNQNKDITVEETEGDFKCIIPYFTPAQAMKFLESRAYSSNSPTCSFRFFENSDEFLFVTDEFLLKRAADSNKIYEFTYAPRISQDPSKFDNRMANFTEFVNTNRFDTFDDLHGGTYKNKVIVLDINNRTANLKDPAFDYFAIEGSSYFKGYNGSVIDDVDRHSAQFVDTVTTDENARRFIMIKDYVDTAGGSLRGEQHIPEIISNRLSYFKNANAIRVNAKGFGRLDIMCGDFVRVQIQDLLPKSAINFNRQLSGTYMVESVSRIFEAGMYMNNYSLIKRNWAQDPDNSYATTLNTGIGPQ